MLRINPVLLGKLFRGTSTSSKFNQYCGNVSLLSQSTCLFNSNVGNTASFLHNETNNKIVEILQDGYRKSRVSVRNIKKLLEQPDEELIKSNHGLLLLQCCGTLLVDQTPETRQALCEQAWERLKKLQAVNVSHYNAYAQVCIQNRIYLNHNDFLKDMDAEPNEETYQLLLRSVCEFGDTGEALRILSRMKEKQLPLDEHVFTSLALAHAIKGGLTEVSQVLNTMQTAQVPVTPAVANSIIRGLILFNNKDDFLEALQRFSHHIKEQNVIELMMVLGLTDNESWLDNVTNLIGLTRISKENSDEFNLMCIRLIHLGKVDSAMLFYKKFVDASSIPVEGDYAFFLLIEMLFSNTSTVKIIEIINNLKAEGLNLMALEKLTITALKKRVFNVAWELLMNMPILRPHFFWPFLLHSSRQQGEIGVLNTLKKMIELNVRPDVDTLEYYCLHLCDTSDPVRVVSQLHHLGLSLREILTPLLAFLLKKNRIEAALRTCESYDAYVSCDRLLKHLIKIWTFTKNTPSTVKILKRIRPNSNDYIGQFLIRLLGHCKSSEDNKNFLNLIQELTRADLKISSTSAETIVNRLKKSNASFVVETEGAVSRLCSKSITSNSIPHPKEMNATELENHLVELETKSMETRGVLRRLITEYCRLGNYKRAFELRDKVLSSGYEESPGMKTAIMHAYVLDGNVIDALKMYTTIKDQHSTFVIDEFKVVDLATVLVKNEQTNTALSILRNESSLRKIQGGPKLVKNCWKLIGSGRDADESQTLFEALVEGGYCTPSNIILGPLIKVHLEKGDLKTAVMRFKEYTEKYKCTPLQLELLSTVVKSEDLDLLQEVLNCCSQVHGFEATVIPTVAALAQNGLHKPLRKLLLEVNRINHKEFEKRCERWVSENKIFALQTLSKALHSLPSTVVDKDVVHYSIMKLHSVNNNCEAAVSFYRELLESEVSVSKRTSDELLRLIQRCKYKVPQELCQ